MSYLYLERFSDQNKALNNHVMLFLDIITWEKNISVSLENIFFNQGGHRCEIFCNEMNKSSRKVAERLGYQLDGIMREYELIDGIYSGVAIYSKINS